MTLKTLSLTAALLSASAVASLSPATAAPLGAATASALAQAEQQTMVLRIRDVGARQGGGADDSRQYKTPFMGVLITEGAMMILNEAARQQAQPAPVQPRHSKRHRKHS